MALTDIAHEGDTMLLGGRATGAGVDHAMRFGAHFAEQRINCGGVEIG